MKSILGTVVLVFSLVVCGAAPGSAKSPSALAQPKGWKAVLIAGDDQEPAFDNAVDAMAEKLAAFDVPWSNMTILRATGLGPHAATYANIRDAFAALNPAAGDGCFVFITSHGAPARGLVLTRERGFLTPGELGALVNGACQERPTVVVASGCYSGGFAEGQALTGANRIILTAARDDRASFGCNANLKFTVFDQCVLDNLQRGIGWRVVMDRTRGCVAEHEKSMGMSPPSTPQISVGAAVGNLQVFPR